MWSWIDCKEQNRTEEIARKQNPAAGEAGTNYDGRAADLR